MYPPISRRKDIGGISHRFPTGWKVSRPTGNIDWKYLKWKVIKLLGKFPGTLESFQTTWTLGFVVTFPFPTTRDVK